VTCVLLCWLIGSAGFMLGASWCALLRDRAREEAVEALLALRSAKLEAGAAGEPPRIGR